MIHLVLMEFPVLRSAGPRTVDGGLDDTLEERAPDEVAGLAVLGVLDHLPGHLDFCDPLV